MRFRLLGKTGVRISEGHGAQRHLRDPHAGLTQKPVTHEIPSLLWIGKDFGLQRKPDTASGVRSDERQTDHAASKLIVITCPERCSRMIGTLLAHGDSEA